MWVRDNNNSGWFIGILNKIVTIILIGLLIIVMVAVYLWDLVWGE